MRVGILKVDLQIPMSRSLKEKRKPIKSLVSRAKNKFNISIAEIDYHDLHQRSLIGISLVAVDGKHLEVQLASITEYLYNNPDCIVLNINKEVY